MKLLIFFFLFHDSYLQFIMKMTVIFTFDRHLSTFLAKLSILASFSAMYRLFWGQPCLWRQSNVIRWRHTWHVCTYFGLFVKKDQYLILYTIVPIYHMSGEGSTFHVHMGTLYPKQTQPHTHPHTHTSHTHTPTPPHTPPHTNKQINKK